MDWRISELVATGVQRLRSFIRLFSNPSSLVYLLGSALAIVTGAFITTVFSGNLFWFSVGTSVVATGVASLLMYFYAVLQPNQSQRLQNIRDFGIEELFEQREAAVLREYDDVLRQAQAHVDVLGLGQRSFLRDHYKDLKSWSARFEIRILLLDPKFPTDEVNFAGQRDGEEEDTPGKIRGDVADFLKRTKELRKAHPPGAKRPFAVRLYRTIPTITIFRVDRTLYWGPYLIKSASRYTPMMRVAQSGLLYGRLLAHFEELWNNDTFSCEVPEEYDV